MDRWLKRNFTHPYKRASFCSWQIPAKMPAAVKLLPRANVYIHLSSSSSSQTKDSTEYSVTTSIIVPRRTAESHHYRLVLLASHQSPAAGGQNAWRR